jgi:phage shock protein PspC (stress-responsive transcriptional regulator)
LKKLYRSTSDKKISGIFGGLARYLNMDSSLLRILTVIVAIVTQVFTFLIVYLVCSIAVPVEGDMK